MQVSESLNASDYTYFPIAYRNRSFSIVITHTDEQYGDYGTWAIAADKEKFLTGSCSDINGSKANIYNLIAVGF